MMLRSSSTPVLGSLLSPEHPNNHFHDITFHPYKISPIHKFSFVNQTVLSCNSSPISPAFGPRGIRRAQSDGNLESLMCSKGNDNVDVNDDDDFSFFKPPKKVSHRCLLETIPSMSYHNSRFRSSGDESSDEEQEEEEKEDEEFSGFNIEKKVMSLNKQMGYGNMEKKYDVGESGSQMYLAKGLGVDAGFGCVDGGAAGSGGGGRNLSRGEGDGEGGGGDNHDVEEHYRKMVNECPGNPLLLGNYAQFLYQSKQDLQGAEEYYSRAILADPNDGEILSQYAKLLWELHHDKERATTYFERAIQVASEDSHVHAAYASFLWEAEGEEDEEEEEEERYYGNIQPLLNNGKMASAATA
ncbi:hypothetical protein M8C21_001453 [Ambrosia artemisiifolia]|uniref:Uncharacterized protein n=1 Tax=Ambrosia artemisiifolia TaxID=4212 RepID=A0AAD5G606_AMBAR|nr:hypothetical protein M8C21_001453 [Ambrosia artemisiifolia]